MKIKTKPQLSLPLLRFKGFFETKYKYLNLLFKTGSITSTSKITSGNYTFFDRSDTIKTINSFDVNGEFIIAPSECYLHYYYINGKFSHHSKTYRVSFDGDIKYLYYLLQSKKNYIMSKGQGAGFKRFGPDLYKNLKTIHICISEQQKIAKFFSLLDKQISLWERKLELYELFYEHYLNYLYSKKRLSNSNITLKEILIRHNAKLENNKFPVSTISNKSGVVLQTDFFKGYLIASKDVSNYLSFPSNYYGYNPARINVGSIAKNNSNITFALSPMYIVFKSIEKSNEFYFFTKSKIFYKYINSLLVGSVRNILNWEALIEIPFIKINLNDEKILFFLKKIEDFIAIINRKISNIVLTKKYLLKKMFI